MTTTVTHTIGTNSREYSTLQSWEDACPVNLVTDDKIWRGECYNDGEYVIDEYYGASLYIAGVTSDDTHYLELTAAVGQSFVDHPDIRTHALAYNQSYGVAISAAGYFSNVIRFTPGVHLHVSRLQMKLIGAPSYVLINAASSGSVFVCRDSIIEAHDCNAVDLRNGGLYNCLVVEVADGHAQAVTVFETAEIINCSIVRVSDKTPGSTGLFATDGAVATLHNTVLVGFVPVTDGTGSIVGDYNATDQASGLPGSHNQYNMSFSQFTPFTNAASGSQDWRSIGGTLLENTGFLDAVNVPNDISGLLRSDPCEIGIWELAGASPPVVFPTIQGIGGMQGIGFITF